MSDIIFELIKVAVMLAILMVTRYMIPWFRDKIGTEQLLVIEKWTKSAVMMAQQGLGDANGVDKKTYVTEFLKKLLTAKNISISDEQLDVLIEAAVKQLKTEENGRIVSKIMVPDEITMIKE